MRPFNLMCMSCLLASGDSVTSLILFCQYLTVPESSNQATWLFFFLLIIVFVISWTPICSFTLMYWAGGTPDPHFILFLIGQSKVTPHALCLRPDCCSFLFCCFSYRKHTPPSALFFCPLTPMSNAASEEERRKIGKEETDMCPEPCPFQIQVHDPLIHLFLPRLFFLPAELVYWHHRGERAVGVIILSFICWHSLS